MSRSRCWDTTLAVLILTSDHELVGGTMSGGEFGAVASERYRKRSKVPSEWTETIRKSKGRRSLTATPTVEQVRKMRLSDPVV